MYANFLINCTFYILSNILTYILTYASLSDGDALREGEPPLSDILDR